MDPSKPKSDDNTDVSAEFSRLYSGCAGWLYGFLFSLLGNHHDAEDVLAETAQVLWQKFDQYSRQLEFRAWAYRIAHYRALHYRAKKQVQGGTYSDLFLARVDEEAVIMADRLDERSAALADCLEKLPRQERQLIQRRYAKGGSVADVAKLFNVPLRKMYRMIERIHAALFECVNRALAQEK